MAIELNTGGDIAFAAGADLSAKRNLIVKLHSTAMQVVVAGAGELSLGVLLNNPAEAGREATVRTTGIAKVAAGAAVTLGADVAADAAGKCVAATSGDFPIGIAMSAVSNADEVLSVLLIQGTIPLA